MIGSYKNTAAAASRRYKLVRKPTNNRATRHKQNNVYNTFAGMGVYKGQEGVMKGSKVKLAIFHIQEPSFTGRKQITGINTFC